MHTFSQNSDQFYSNAESHAADCGQICCSAASCCMMEQRLDWTRVMPRPPACRLPFRIFHHSSHHHQNDHLKPRKHGLTLVIIPNRTCISSQCQNHRPTIYNLIYENNFKTPTVLTLEIRAKIIILDWSSGILTLGVGLFLFSFSCLYFCGSY